MSKTKTASTKKPNPPQPRKLVSQMDLSVLTQWPVHLPLIKKVANGSTIFITRGAVPNTVKVKVILPANPITCSAWQSVFLHVIPAIDALIQQHSQPQKSSLETQNETSTKSSPTSE